MKGMSHAESGGVGITAYMERKMHARSISLQIGGERDYNRECEVDIETDDDFMAHAWSW